MSNRQGTYLHVNKRAGSEARDAVVREMDPRQPVSQATWDVYARCLTAYEMEKNFVLARFSREPERV